MSISWPLILIFLVALGATIAGIVDPTIFGRTADQNNLMIVWSAVVSCVTALILFIPSLIGMVSVPERLNALQATLGAQNQPNSIAGRLSDLQAVLGLPNQADNIAGRLNALRATLGAQDQPGSVAGRLSDLQAVLGLPNQPNNIAGRLNALHTRLDVIGEGAAPDPHSLLGRMNAFEQHLPALAPPADAAAILQRLKAIEDKLGAIDTKIPAKSAG